MNKTEILRVLENHIEPEKHSGCSVIYYGNFPQVVADLDQLIKQVKEDCAKIAESGKLSEDWLKDLEDKEPNDWLIYTEKNNLCDLIAQTIRDK